jgi:putative membrane protein
MAAMMWDGWNGHMSGWGWVWMIGGTILLLAVLAALTVVIVRALDRPAERRAAPQQPPAEQLLAERFARGEIDEEEYRGRLAILRSDDLAQTP